MTTITEPAPETTSVDIQKESAIATRLILPSPGLFSSLNNTKELPSSMHVQNLFTNIPQLVIFLMVVVEHACLSFLTQHNNQVYVMTSAAKFKTCRVGFSWMLRVCACVHRVILYIDHPTTQEEELPDGSVKLRIGSLAGTS